MAAARNIWSDIDTSLLISLIGENIYQLPGKKLRSNEVFKVIGKKLAENGVNKTWEQARTKWKALKCDYNRAKKRNSVSGMPRAIMSHYDALDAILGCRQLANSIECGVESMEESPETHDLPTENSENTENELSFQDVLDDDDGDGVVYAAAIMTVGDDSQEGKNEEEPSTETMFTTDTSAERASARLDRKRKLPLSKQEAAMQQFSKEQAKMLLEFSNRQQAWFTEIVEKQQKFESNLSKELIEAMERTGNNMVSTLMSGIHTLFSQRSMSYSDSNLQVYQPQRPFHPPS